MMLDLRYAVRTLLKNPGFALVAVLTLAVGIGANTAIFSVVHSVLLRPLPYPAPDRIVNVWTSTGREAHDNHSAGDFLDIRDGNQSLSAIAGFRTAFFTVAGRAAEPAQLEGSYVTLDFFDVLGVTPAAGRLFSPALDRSPGEKLIVLGDAAWQQLFDRSGEAVGARVRVDGQPYTVAGVLPPRTQFPESSKVWLLSDKPVPPSPLAMPNDPATDRDVRYFSAIARLRPGVTLVQAGQDLERVATGIQQRHPQTAAGRTVKIAPLYDDMVEGVRWGLLVLQGAVGLVLLIACANVSSLLIARASGRKRELAIRAALGAARLRLVRQLLTESLLLSVLGGLSGLLLGAWLIGIIVRVLPDAVPRASQIGVNPAVAGSALLTALLAAVIFGVAPSLQASRADATGAMRQGGDRGSSGRARGRSVLVVGEIALTLVLLAGAGLLLNSFLRLQRVESGMRPENVTLLSLALPASRYPTDAAQTAVYGRLVEHLSAQPGVEAVGVGFPGPLRGSNASGSFFIEGRRSQDRSDQPTANLGSVSGGFFSAMGIPLLSGRTFAESDGAKDPGVAVASVALARKYWPGENVVGKRVRFESDAGAPWMTIVGLVGDVRQLGLDQSAPPILYIPYRQFALPFTTVAVRSTMSAAAVTAILRTAVTSVDPELPFGELSTLQRTIDRSIDQPRFRATLLAAFAGAAVILAAVGVFGLISYSVSSRTREIGIRLALGAQPRQVLLSIMQEGLVLALLGIAIGLAGAIAAARVIASFLYGVRAGDPVTYAGVAALLLAVALFATYLPSRRALRVDPIAALRAD